jgi:tricorn protease
MNKSHIVFSYASDLWKVPRDGGDAVRFTTGVGLETDPFFSPDGKWVAFTGEYEGNYDVYFVSAEGGVPTRLTYHPGQDRVVGWTPDSKRVLFRSPRTSYSRADKLFSVGVEGGLPQELPFPMGIQGSYSADASQIAYVPIGMNRPFNSLDAWKRYRGGRAPVIWIAKLGDSSITKIPHETSNDTDPMWIGSKIYFLSDRSGPATLFAYDTTKKAVTQVVPNSGMDIKSATAGPGGIVYDQFGALNVYDTASGKTRKIDVNLTGDLPEVRPRFVNVAAEVQQARLSPTGVRALFETHGEILTVPVEKGDVRNLSGSPGAMDRAPVWSPDGKYIAWFSDQTGDYKLHIAPQNGAGDVRKLPVEAKPAFYYKPEWSPDSKKIAFIDNRLNVWFMDLDSGKATKIDTDTYYDPVFFLDPTWSPDSRWIAYTRQLKNHLRAVFLYSLETGKPTQVTDGMSDARYAQFDKDGKHLYFTASTNSGPTSGWLDMSGDPHRVTRSVYVVVLSKTGTSPLAPESDEEKGAEETKKEPEKKPAEKPLVTVDFEGIGQRILALPVPPADYTALQAGKSGVLFLSEDDGAPRATPAETLHRFTLKTRKVERLMDGIRSFDVSFDGGKVLAHKGTQFIVFNAAEMPKAGEGVLKTDAMEVKVDPRAEWKQMYHEVWRIERDFFYDPGYHGLDLAAAEKKYEPYLESVASRADLNYLFQDMLGELTV